MEAFCAAVDWGTSSFRLWVLAEDGTVLAKRQSGQGMSSLRPEDFEGVLERNLENLGLAGEVPVVICGMAGAAQGWLQAPYRDLPARLAEIPAAAARVPSGERDIRILPGLAQRDPARPDVIRGEETLLLGAHLEKTIEGTVCLPGTHSKWVRIDDGYVTGFSTAMTGEVFALLARQSTLAHFVAPDEQGDSEDAAFSDAVRDSLEAPKDVLRALFSVRASPLLGFAQPNEMTARLSGLLIGLEIAGMKETTRSHITLISSGALARTYARAFATAGLDFDVYDSGEMVRAGLAFAARTFWTGSKTLT